MYKQVDPRVSFPLMEEEILKFWKEKDIFKRSIEQREGCQEYIMFDGPPFATGLPHFGHFVPGTIKDIFPRYQTMKGKKVERRFGWDCHGLPVEFEMEKELGISGKTEIEKYGIPEFNEKCRSIVLRFTKEWESVINRLGRWVDFDNDYKTMDPDYMESIWWVFKQLWDKELVYEGHRIMPYCPRCSTVLSTHELNMGGYEDVHDNAITVKFKLKDEDNTFFMAWTTTPWTLPSNLALAVGPEIEYVKVKDKDEDCYYIMAKERVSAYYKLEEGESLDIVWEKKGSDLLGLSYEPLMPYFEDAVEQGAFKVFTADYVTTDSGTGIVHIAPGFGEDDHLVLKGTGIKTVCPIDGECKFTGEIPDYKDRYVKDCDKDITNRLKEEGKLIKREQYLHSYPHCWRCKSPLIYRAISSWFIDVDQIKDKMLSANEQINWVPSHLQKGRFGKWLEGAREWSVSRNRYWGNPIPIWQCPDCKKDICIGSRQELENLSGKTDIDDLHKHFVDDITIPCSCGGTMKRVEEVLDCWFESGAMPYAQNHYPFENKEMFEANYPADFISEGLDQTRGWFYTLTVLAAALFDKPAFKNVVVNGLVLAADGKKMSKSLRNYTDPMEVINNFGADALRLFLMHSSVVKGEGLKYSDDGVKDVLKSIILPLWNAYSFFITYANIDNVTIKQGPKNPENPLDKWIISETETLIANVTEKLDAYDVREAIDEFVKFIDSLNNWYIRRSRKRFWKSESDNDKTEAYQAIWYALMNLVKVACPFVPYISEEIYQNLRTEDMPESVHLCDFPVAKVENRDERLELKMSLTRQAVSMGRALRSLHTLKTRQPLKSMFMVTRDENEKSVLLEMSDIIKEELNVKEVLLRENEEELVEYSCKANFKVLGKLLGKNMKNAAAEISKLDGSAIKGLLEGKTLTVSYVGSNKTEQDVEITEEHVVISRAEKEGLKVLNEGMLTIALDAVLTDELIQEGIVRDIIRGVNNLRKDSNLEVVDRISLGIEGSDKVKEAAESFKEYLLNETLATTLDFTSKEFSNEVSCGDETCTIFLEKA
ncbi:isoleucine--tRNA ligase [Thiospirochaeta perfilievii]|uniref:Isoleucine--tRNA ligase n=1 Tax=Thiospirochaeta perfilievii TaxID=252967 RepID=A0A5C1QAD1_9SPIO|nr:isoleucine--tRNA ligase [Thiospirochaeta perfilievii]QEN04010.1 isoleucine--tRNA ligase [Thiospirochaeta perfilievii]